MSAKIPNPRRQAACDNTGHGLQYREPLCYPYEDPACYQEMRDAFVEGPQPANTYEMALVEQIIDCQWQWHLDRTHQIEVGPHGPRRQRIRSQTSLRAGKQTAAHLHRYSRLFDLLLRYRTEYDRSMHRCQRALFDYRESMADRDPLPPVAPVQTDEPQLNSPETPSPEPDIVIDTVDAVETSNTAPTPQPLTRRAIAGIDP